MKKIFTLFLLSLFMVTNLNFVNAMNVYSSEKYNDLEYSRSDLLKIKNGDKYTKKIDSIVKSISNNEKKLEKVLNKINDLIDKKAEEEDSSEEYIENSFFDSDIYIILMYLSDKISYELEKFENLRIKEGLKKFDKTLSKEDNKKFNDELVKLQQTLFENGIGGIESLIKDFEKYTNYEESGNLNISAKFDKEEFGKFDFDLKLKNYLTKNSNFNGSFQAEIEALINAVPKGEKAVKLQFKSFIDFISKDGNMYILLKDLEIIDEENIKEFKSFIESAKEIAKKNKYIKYSDNESKIALEMFKNLNPQNILADGKNILSKPMFKAYKKVGKKYYLIPTKYACDSMKAFGGKFDPFHSNNSCSEGQYNDLLKNLTDTGEIYLELGKFNKFGFEMGKKGDLESAKGYILFSENNIEEVNYKIVPNIKKYAGEGFSLDYKRNNNLDFELIVKEENIKYNFNSKLDNKNKFNFIDFKGHSADKNDDFAIKFLLKNHIISGDIEANTSKYNWETGESKKENNFKVGISGKTNVRNELDNINLELVGKNIYTNKKFEVAKLEYSKGNIKFENNYSDENFENDLKIDLSCDTKNKTLKGLDFDLSVKSREGSYDYNTYEYVYTGALIEIVDVELLLKNSNISGKTIIKETNGDDMFSVNHSGKYGKNTLDLKNDFEFGKNPLEKMDNNGYSLSEIKVKNDIGTINFKINFINNTKLINYSEFKKEGNKIDFKILGENEEDFINPNGEDYLIFTTEDSYSIYGNYLDNNGNKIAVVLGNSLESLVKIDGKIIKNGDIVGKGDIEKKVEKKLSGELNIKYDVNNNKNNIEFYFDLKEDSAKFAEYKIKNESKKIYKKNVEIKTPKNTLDLEEVVPTTYNDLY